MFYAVYALYLGIALSILSCFSLPLFADSSGDRGTSFKSTQPSGLMSPRPSPSQQEQDLTIKLTQLQRELQLYLAWAELKRLVEPGQADDAGWMSASTPIIDLLLGGDMPDSSSVGDEGKPHAHAQKSIFYDLGMRLVAKAAASRPEDMYRLVARLQTRWEALYLHEVFEAHQRQRAFGITGSRASLVLGASTLLNPQIRSKALLRTVLPATGAAASYALLHQIDQSFNPPFKQHSNLRLPPSHYLAGLSSQTSAISELEHQRQIRDLVASSLGLVAGERSFSLAQSYQRGHVSRGMVKLAQCGIKAAQIRQLAASLTVAGLTYLGTHRAIQTSWQAMSEARVRRKLATLLEEATPDVIAVSDAIYTLVARSEFPLVQAVSAYATGVQESQKKAGHDPKAFEHHLQAHMRAFKDSYRDFDLKIESQNRRQTVGRTDRGNAKQMDELSLLKGTLDKLSELQQEDAHWQGRISPLARLLEQGLYAAHPLDLLAQGAAWFYKQAQSELYSEASKELSRALGDAMLAQAKRRRFFYEPLDQMVDQMTQSEASSQDLSPADPASPSTDNSQDDDEVAGEIPTELDLVEVLHFFLEQQQKEASQGLEQPNGALHSSSETTARLLAEWISASSIEVYNRLLNEALRLYAERPQSRPALLKLFEEIRVLIEPTWVSEQFETPWVEVPLGAIDGAFWVVSARMALQFWQPARSFTTKRLPVLKTAFERLKRFARLPRLSSKIKPLPKGLAESLANPWTQVAAGTGFGAGHAAHDSWQDRLKPKRLHPTDAREKLEAKLIFTMSLEVCRAHEEWKSRLSSLSSLSSATSTTLSPELREWVQTQQDLQAERLEHVAFFAQASPGLRARVAIDENELSLPQELPQACVPEALAWSVALPALKQDIEAFQKDLREDGKVSLENE